jgi:hypothetical protein
MIRNVVRRRGGQGIYQAVDSTFFCFRIFSGVETEGLLSRCLARVTFQQFFSEHLSSGITYIATSGDAAHTRNGRFRKKKLGKG